MSTGSFPSALSRAAEGSRDYSVFDAELAGKAFDAKLLGRLLRWVRPHWRLALCSALLVVVASVLAILGPVVISRVVIDGLLLGNQPIKFPDFGMNAVYGWVASHTGVAPLVTACVLFMEVKTGRLINAHYH